MKGQRNGAMEKGGHHGGKEDFFLSVFGFV